MISKEKTDYFSINTCNYYTRYACFVMAIHMALYRNAFSA